MGGEDRVTSALDLTFLVKQEGDVWVGLCLELDIAGEGDTKEEAIEALKDLVELYITSCTELGEVPVPLRPVPPDALADFFTPCGEESEVAVTGHRESVPLHAAA